MKLYYHPISINCRKARLAAAVLDLELELRLVDVFRQFAVVLDTHLEGRELMVGKSLTLADLSIASGLTFAGPAEFPVAPFENVRRWFASIERLDAWKRTAPPAMA